MCHNNGPRAIRPEPGTLGLWDQARVFAWNLRVKTYGRLKPDLAHDEEDKFLKTHFRWHGGIENDELKIGVCVKCHREDGLFARGALRRQQAGTIEFMTSRGLMPPPGFSMNGEERAELKKFLLGF
jgi:hypothetical protein